MVKLETEAMNKPDAKTPVFLRSKYQKFIQKTWHGTLNVLTIFAYHLTETYDMIETCEPALATW